MLTAELALNIETPNFFVRYYKKDPRRVVVSFSSMGFAAQGVPIEEFRSSLDKTGVSYIFVTDRNGNWYNNDETDKLFWRVAELCSTYDFVAAIGESSGACGAILFTNYFTNIRRVLAFAPQFSVSKPYFNLEERHVGKLQTTEKFYKLDFSSCTNKKNIQLLYGNRDWHDFIHSSMFSEMGFRVTHIDGAGHEVAVFLKREGKWDGFTPLIKAFCDIDCYFTSEEVATYLGPLVASKKLSLENCELYATSISMYAEPNAFDEMSDLRLISLNCPALQSSASEWSKNHSAKDDAGGGNDGCLDKDFGFHTDFEADPWWQVDLIELQIIKEIRIYNRYSNFEIASRSANFEILIRRSEADEWSVLVEREGLMPIGLFGEPFIWRAIPPVEGRFIRIRIIGENYMHYRQIEVYA